MDSLIGVCGYLVDPTSGGPPGNEKSESLKNTTECYKNTFAENEWGQLAGNLIENRSEQVFF